jgi:hypothetical protein
MSAHSNANLSGLLKQYFRDWLNNRFSIMRYN